MSLPLPGWRRGRQRSHWPVFGAGCVTPASSLAVRGRPPPPPPPRGGGGGPPQSTEEVGTRFLAHRTGPSAVTTRVRRGVGAAGAALWGRSRAALYNCTFARNGIGLAVMDEPIVEVPPPPLPPLFRTPKPETRNPKPEPRTPKPETRNPKPEIRTRKPETRNPKRQYVRKTANDNTTGPASNITPARTQDLAVTKETKREEQNTN